MLTAMKTRRFILLAAAMFATTAAPALAVPVGTTGDTRPAAPQHRPQWKQYGFDAQFSGDFLQGNVNLLNLSASTNLNANFGPHQFFIDAGNLITRSGNSTIVNRFSGSTMYAYAWYDNLNLYAFTTHSFDQSIKLNYRLTSGVGVCRHKIATDVFSLFLVSLGPAYENAWYENDVYEQYMRAMLRVNATKPLGDRLELGFDAFYTPAVTEFGNYRIYGEASFKYKLTDILSLKLTAADEYDSRPQPGILNNDLGVFTTLEAEWGR